MTTPTDSSSSALIATPDATEMEGSALIKEREIVRLSDLKPHSRNYRKHPEAQLAHLAQSLREHGVYRNVVVAKDYTILAGHGVVQAAELVGIQELPVVRLEIGPLEPKALKLLAADNELSRFADTDDRALTELLREISQIDEAGLFGTGYDEAQLAALVMVTRPSSEIADRNAAAQWVGLPEFEGADPSQVIGLGLQFTSSEDRDKVVEALGLKGVRHSPRVWTAWWPPRERDDSASVVFDG